MKKLPFYKIPRRLAICKPAQSPARWGTVWGADEQRRPSAQRTAAPYSLPPPHGTTAGRLCSGDALSVRVVIFQVNVQWSFVQNGTCALTEIQYKSHISFKRARSGKLHAWIKKHATFWNHAVYIERTEARQIAESLGMYVQALYKAIQWLWFS